MKELEGEGRQAEWRRQGGKVGVRSKQNEC